MEESGLTVRQIYARVSIEEEGGLHGRTGRFVAYHFFNFEWQREKRFLLWNLK
jgi:hypothetical protein